MWDIGENLLKQTFGQPTWNIKVVMMTKIYGSNSKPAG